MRMKTLKPAALVILLGMLSLSTVNAQNWPQWRGPSLNGVSNEKNLPVEWTHRREHRLETRPARLERLNANHLARSHLSQCR